MADITLGTVSLGGAIAPLTAGVAGLAGPVFPSSSLIKRGLIGAFTLLGVGVELETLFSLAGGALLGVGVAGTAAEGTVHAGSRVGAVEERNGIVTLSAYTGSMVLAL